MKLNIMDCFFQKVPENVRTKTHITRKVRKVCLIIKINHHFSSIEAIRSLDGQQNKYQIDINFLDIIHLKICKNPYILALKFDYFAISQYRALILRKIIK